MRLHVNCKFVNSNGTVFESTGYYWDDGVLFVKNPRPDLKPYKGLICKSGSKALYWTNDPGNPDDCEPSKFKIQSIILNSKEFLKR